MIRGVIFDLDGTLVDSRLDFDAMRRDMELPADLPILETLAHLPPEQAARCHEILHRHELAGADRAELLPGVRELIAILQRRGIHLAIFTRNSRRVTDATLAKLDLPIELTFTRDDGPVKPDPWAVLEAARRWNISPIEIIVVGDYRFDIDSGRAAGSHTVLLTAPLDPHTYPNHEQANLVLSSLADYQQLLDFFQIP